MAKLVMHVATHPIPVALLLYNASLNILGFSTLRPTSNETGHHAPKKTNEFAPNA